jgi:lipopolysaccharide transport system ATP-binding protein
VKHYSSGMYVRLAFAVAAHLEPEILLVDEVLAVGDAAFQKKCLGKMRDVAKEGRTVLFVSHNMGAITALCSRAILLADGNKIADGSASTVVEGYVASVSDATGSSYVCQEQPNGRAWIVSANLKSEDGQNSGTFLMSEPIIVECVLNIIEKSQLTLSVQIKEMNNSPIYHFPNSDSSYVLPFLPGSYRIKVYIPPLSLYPGKYLLQLSLCDPGAGGHFEELCIVESISFHVQQDYSLCDRPLGRHAGLVFARAEWSVEGMSSGIDGKGISNELSERRTN